MNETRNALTFFVILLLSALQVLSQVQEQNSAGELTIKLPTDLVVLDAEVLGKKNKRTINGLRRADFTLYEDGERQELTHFSHGRVPLSVILLLDVSESVWRGLEQIQVAALQSLQRLKPEDEVALMVFAYSATLVQDFTTDRQLLTEKIATVASFKTVGTQVNGALYQAAGHLSKASDPGNRRAVIAITDNKSQPVSDNDVSIEETEKKLAESGTVVCGLIVGPFEYETKTWKIFKYYPPIFVMDKILSGRRKEEFRDYLNPHANATGGVVLAVKNKEMTAKFSEMLERLRNRYSFGYMPANQQMDGKFRKIKLSVTSEVEKQERGVIILTRQGYYARPRNVTSEPESKETKP